MKRRTPRAVAAVLAYAGGCVPPVAVLVVALGGSAKFWLVNVVLISAFIWLMLTVAMAIIALHACLYRGSDRALLWFCAVAGVLSSAAICVRWREFWDGASMGPALAVVTAGCIVAALLMNLFRKREEGQR